MNNLFEGVKVIDFSNNFAGPVGTMNLADFGAEVIKIEKPVYGDDSRHFSPQLNGVGVPFMYVNRNKKSIVLNINEPEGQEIALKLIADADIVVESFRPGTMAKYGLDYKSIQKINASVIMCSLSAYGQSGPDSKKPGYDIVAQAQSGFMDLCGEPDEQPNRSGFALADYNAGTHAFAAMAAALYYRKCTGKGQYIDISLLDCLVSFNGLVENAWLGLNPTRTGNRHPVLVPFGLYKGTGGSIVIAAANQKLWESICDVMGREDLKHDSGVGTPPDRVKNQPKVTAYLEGWLQSFPNIDEPLELLDNAGIPCGKVATTTQLLENKQLKARDMITELETPDGVTPRKIMSRGTPFKFSEVKALRNKGPVLGQDMDNILKSLGYSEEQIANLKKKWNVH